MTAVLSPAQTTATPVDQESVKAVARVNGDVWDTLPDDLYIPPDALEVFLESFEGPLDLLLYLIKKQNLSIENIPIAAITAQYMQYVDMMKAYQLELAAEYLVMAALLAEIKSRCLLPRVESDEEDEEDPRATLIRRLQEYERYRQAADNLDELPRVNRDIFIASVKKPTFEQIKVFPDVELDALIQAFQGVLERASLNQSHQILREPLSVRDRMQTILGRLNDQKYVRFVSFFDAEEGRSGVVVTFLAMMELIKEKIIEISQSELFGEIHLKTRNQVTS